MRRAICWTIGLAVPLVLLWLLDVERGNRGRIQVPEEAGVGADTALEAEPLERSLPEDPAETPPVRAEASAGPSGSESGPTLRVLVRDARDGRPVPGALVTLFDRASPAPRRTDVHGVSVLPLADPTEEVRLRVEAAGYFHADAKGLPPATHHVNLRRSARLHGRVLAADTGKPVPGAMLALPHEWCASCEPERVCSAGDGTYELSSVPLRRPVVLDVEAQGFAPARHTFELRSDEHTVAQDICLVRGTEMTGRVEDWSSGLGLPGARVGELVTDEEGRFRGRILSHGPDLRVSFDIRAPGHAALHVELDLTLAGELVFRLPRLAFLEGQVTDSTGQPLREALVSFEAAGPIRTADGAIEETSPLYELPGGWSYSLEEREEPSDESGRYRTPVLPWSLNGEASVYRQWFKSASARLRSIGEPGSVLPLDWSLERSTSTTVGGWVTLDGQSCSLEGTVLWRGPTRSGSAHFRNFYSLHVEPGDVRLSVALDGLPPLPPNEVVTRVREGEHRSLDLDVAAPSAAITGSVRFEDGAPVDGAEVTANCSLPWDPRSPGLLHRALTYEDGRFELLVIDVGLPFVVTTRDFEGEVLTLEGVLPGATGADFVLARGYRAFVRVREGRTGVVLEPDEEVQLLARGEPRYGFSRPEFASLVPDAAGWYEVRLTAPEVDLLALSRTAELPLHGACLLRRAKVDGPEPARLELVLERGLDVELELAEGSAAWPADHELLLVAEELWNSVGGTRQRWSTEFDELAERCSVRFDEKGRATVRGLAPGNYRFKVVPPRLQIDPDFVRVDEGTLPVLLRWFRRE